MTGANKKYTSSEKKGTFTRNDPTKTKEDNKLKDPIKKERVPTCWNCVESGHRSNECTKPKNKLNHVQVPLTLTVKTSVLILSI